MSSRQNETLLAALAKRPMTAGEIWTELGIARAAARVFDLRAIGYDIQSTEITVPNRTGGTSRVAQYSLHGNQLSLIPNHPGRGLMHAAA